ncbi:hypothetical protein [Glaciecola sp. 33A]|jgi:hypothetical protein|uniref:hypothetical protein n=1 Tax=Glaciecola sp. 33A TaxID=2057807 RepID=UPI000C345AF4|nr:hypothetical protein [Glaciecola sp. 33A]PKI02997.1 hypothetical protein CXF81_04220 [Glaciecola sp. 33A]
MRTNKTHQNKANIGNFAALNTSIVNEEEQLVKKLLVKELLENEAMQELEKNYLIDIAKHKNNRTIIKLLEDIPLKQ